MVWRTQAGGEGFTTVKAAEQRTVLLMIDRNELEDQMHHTSPRSAWATWNKPAASPG